MASAVADQSSVGQLIEPHSQQTSNMNKQHKVKIINASNTHCLLTCIYSLFVHQEKRVN